MAAKKKPMMPMMPAKGGYGSPPLGMPGKPPAFKKGGTIKDKKGKK